MTSSLWLKSCFMKDTVTTVFIGQSVSGLLSSPVVLYKYACTVVGISKYWPKDGIVFNSSSHAIWSLNKSYSGRSYLNCLSLCVNICCLPKPSKQATANIPSNSLRSISRCRLDSNHQDLAFFQMWLWEHPGMSLCPVIWYSIWLKLWICETPKLFINLRAASDLTF